MQKIYSYLGLVSDPSIAVACYENNKAPDTVPEILKAFWQVSLMHQEHIHGRTTWTSGIV